MSADFTKENITESKAQEFSKESYLGRPSTLCKGCGHDTISQAIRTAVHELQIPPWGIGKMSGIGCSSKTPAYFLGQSSGFNSVHGRMPSMTTGAVLVRPSLKYIGVSGDGDTASIGIGQYIHMSRRNVNVVYLIENNGAYGLTKGQFSATADEGTTIKGSKVPNPFPSLDCALLAIESGATFVARSFSGDRKQLVTLLKAAISHRGTAVIDIISPCVAFNDHDTSTKGYKKMQSDRIILQEMGYIPHTEEISIEQKEGTDLEIKLHDGSILTIHKLDNTFDPTNQIKAINLIHEEREQGKINTGLLYVNSNRDDLAQSLNIVQKDLAELTDYELRPGPEVLRDLFNRS